MLQLPERDPPDDFSHVLRELTRDYASINWAYFRNRLQPTPLSLSDVTVHDNAEDGVGFAIPVGTGKVKVKRVAVTNNGGFCIRAYSRLLLKDATVRGNGYTNHCPRCLWSRHVDVSPGDRASDCGGPMEPVGALYEGGKFVVVQRCQKCGHGWRNKSARNDSRNAVLALFGRVVEDPRG